MLLLSTMHCSLRFSDADLDMYKIVPKVLRYRVTGGIAGVAETWVVLRFLSMRT
jgi:hypothetical protein